MSIEEYNWFIIKCPCGSEQKFIAELTEHLIRLKSEHILKDFFIPNLVHPKGRVTMGSYVFIEAKETEVLDTAINRIVFASYLLSNGSPAKTTKEEIAKMRNNQAEEEKQKEEENKLEEGQKALIIDGPFKDFEGIIEKIDEKTSLVSVLVSVLGSQLSVKDLPFSSINVINREGKIITPKEKIKEEK